MGILKIIMHWCVYLLPIRNTKHNQLAQHNPQPRVVKTVGVIAKTSKWLLEKPPLKVVPSQKNKC